MAYYQVAYGSISFQYKVLTSAAAIIYEEDRATVIGTAYSFTVDSWITGNTEAAFGSLLQSIKCQLETPRLPFLVRWSPDGATWTVLYQFDSTTDIAYGPQPQNVNITRFSGGKAARITFDLQVQVKQCFSNMCGSMALPNDVLAYTRVFDHKVDADGFTRRTISGKLVITGNAVIAGTSPDVYRNLVAPPDPIYFQRLDQDFQVSVDGRTMTYSVTDQEVLNTLPAPITSGDASYTVSTDLMGGLVTRSISGEFSAPASVPKSAILQRIGDLVSAKFPVAAGNPLSLVPTIKEITERNMYGKNTLSFSFTANQSSGQNAADATQFNFTTGLETIGIPLPNSNGIAWIATPYGGDGQPQTSGVIAVPLSLYDACTNELLPFPPNATTPGGPNTPDGTPPTSQGGTRTSGDNPSGAGAPSLGLISPSQLSSPRFEYCEVIQWRIHNHVATLLSKLPTAGPVMFQTAPPTVTVQQAGYVKQAIQNLTDAPDPPDPYYDASTAAMLRAWTDAEVGQMIGEGPFFLFTVRWHYVMRMVANVNSGIPGPGGSAGLTFPDDPRITATPPDFNMPAGLVTDPT